MKKLYRSSSNKIIAGVCGGLGEYFSVDPVLFRIIFVVMSLVQGMGLILYLILAIIIPKQQEEKKEEVKLVTCQKTSPFFGAVLVAVGLFILFFQFNINWTIVIGLTMIAVGLYMLYEENR
jgi:phage shock protein C